MTGPAKRRPSSVALRLEQRLGRERIRAYRDCCSGDLGRALALYAWNSAVSAAFFETLGHIEIVLRNALHEQLTAWHQSRGRPGHWYDDPAGLLAPRCLADIAEARRRLARAGRPVTDGRIIAELSFGFWRFLLDRRHQAVLWAPALRHAFPHLKPRRRADVYSPIDRLVWLRNRIAHHEPVHNRPLWRYYGEGLRVIGYIDPSIARWIARTSRVDALLDKSPLDKRRAGCRSPAPEGPSGN